MIRLTLTIAITALTACGPAQIPTRATAERLCADEARQADGISGNIGVSGGSAGPAAGANLSINSNILNPRNEQDALRECVNRRLGGQPNPSRPGLTVGISAGASI